MIVRLPTVVVTADDHFHVVRAWPKSETHVLLELRDSTGGTVAGQWFAHSHALAAAEDATPAPAFVAGNVLIQPDGADAKLRALPEVLRYPPSQSPWADPSPTSLPHASPPRASLGEGEIRRIARPVGHQLVSHRPSRRAVVRHVGADGAALGYTKVVRASRAAEIARRGQLATELLNGAALTPRLLETSDVEKGILRWSVVAGDTLADLGTHPTWTPERGLDAWRAAGEAVARLHSADPMAVDATHGPSDELRAIENWLQPAIALGLLERGLVDTAMSRVSELLLNGPTSALGVLHRDLHDKQILLDESGRIGLIDVDTLAVGERALDVANLLVHLDLRELQGNLTPEVAASSRESFLSAVGAASVPSARIEAYAAATRLRLAGVYAFRPRWRDVAAELLRQVAHE